MEDERWYSCVYASLYTFVCLAQTVIERTEARKERMLDASVSMFRFVSFLSLGDGTIDVLFSCSFLLYSIFFKSVSDLPFDVSDGEYACLLDGAVPFDPVEPAVAGRLCPRFIC